MENNIGCLLDKRAFLAGEVTAYVDSHRDERLTYAELAERSWQVSNMLCELGIGVGDRVGLLLMNSSEFLEAYFAIARIGAVIVPLNWRLVADELEFILADSDCRALVYDSEFVEVVETLHERGERVPVSHWLQVTDSDCSPFAADYRALRNAASTTRPPVRGRDDDMLYIMYTSGTTGLPKGVVHTHASALWGVLTIAATIDLRLQDVYLQPLPMFHVGALTPATVGIYRGVTLVMMRSFEPRLAWQLIERERVTTGLCVPAMLNFMLHVPDVSEFDSSTVRWMLCGAAPVSTNLIEQYAGIGIEIHQVYGLTETCGPACVIDGANALRRAGSTGRAFMHTDVKLVRADGTECDRGEPGEVLVRGPHIMREYWNRPEATAETLVDGWLHTGDVAVMDEDGFVSIQDRIKDMIISGGENVYPAEVEGVLEGHPDVVEAAVIGQSSERWGESPFAILVRRRDDLTIEEVLEWCRGRLAPYKLPKGGAFLDTIPRNPSGKILKRLLRDQFPGPAPH